MKRRAKLVLSPGSETKKQPPSGFNQAVEDAVDARVGDRPEQSTARRDSHGAQTGGTRNPARNSSKWIVVAVLVAAGAISFYLATRLRK